MTSVAETVRQALEQQQSGNWHQAEQLYRQALQAEPGNAEAWRRLGTLCQARGRLEEAVACLQQAVQAAPAFGEAHNELGIALAQAGRADEALPHFREAARLLPSCADPLNNAGIVHAGRGNLEEAVASFRQAVRLRPDFAVAHCNLGKALYDQGRLHDAAASFQEALRLQPNYSQARQCLDVVLQAARSARPAAPGPAPASADAYFAQGVALHQRGDLEGAMACYRQALCLRPDYAEALNNLGSALTNQGRVEEAVASFHQALHLRPGYPEAHNNLGVALADQGRLDEAVASYQQALRLLPAYPEAHNNLGIALKNQGRLEEAVTSFHQALRLRPEYPEAYNNLGNALKEQGRLDEAVASYRQALRLWPGYVDAHANLGLTLRDQGRLEEALASIRLALDLRPDNAEAHVSRAEIWLLTGNFAQGWPEYEWRWRWRPFLTRSFPQPRWDGSPLGSRTILLHAEQGFGDTLQFIRYAALVKQRGGTVIVEAPPSLLPLLATCPGVDHLVAEGSPVPAFDVQASLMSLPAVFGTTLATIPAAVPYLTAEPRRVEHWRDELASLGGLKVGIAWQGRPTHKRDRQRSVPLHYFEPLARLPGVRLVSLQLGPSAAQLTTVVGRCPVTDLGSRLDPGTFADAAAALMSLDLVVTVDTALAHLAGALGVPAWVTLPFAPDFRWLLHREDSPWYPTLRLFRQPAPGDWESVFPRLRDALRALAAAPPRERRP